MKLFTLVSAAFVVMIVRFNCSGQNYNHDKADNERAYEDDVHPDRHVGLFMRMWLDIRNMMICEILMEFVR